MSGQFKKPDQPVVVEPVPISDIFAEGIARIERLGPCMRFHLYVTETDPDGMETRVIVAKIVTPAETMMTGVRQTLGAIDGEKMIKN